MIFKYGGVVNLKDLNVKLIVKSTDLDYLYGQDERSGICYKYDILNALLYEASPKELVYCRNGYRIDGVKLTIGGDKTVVGKYARAGDDPIWLENHDGVPRYDELSLIRAKALSLFVKPNVDGDRIYQILKLKDYGPEKFKIKRLDDNSLVLKVGYPDYSCSSIDNYCWEEVSVKEFLLALPG